MRLCCRSVFFLWLAALMVATGQTAAADEPAVNQPESTPEPYVRISSAGLMRYSDEAWGIVQATAVNHGTESVDVNGVAWFEPDPGLQFSRRFLVPPKSSRTVWMPVLTPKLPRDVEAVDFQWATIRKDGTLASNRQGERLSDVTIRVPASRLVIADVSGRSREHAENSEVLRQIRNEIGPDALVLSLMPPFPPAREAWDVADIVVVATDDIARDSATLNALRLWTQDGGRLWLQVDHVQSETVTALLGDSLPFQEIDRTSVVEVEMLPAEESQNFNSQRIGFERPVSLTRVLVQAPAEIHQRLDGWPAAFSFPYGNGKVFCTAANLSAWFAPRHWRRQEEIADATSPAWFDATDAGRIVVRELSLFPEPTVAPEALTEYVVSQVGYTTPRRSSVAVFLIGFTVVLSVVSCVLRFRQKSGWMMWAIPFIAVAASAGLVGVGRAARGEPKGRVLAQIVEAEPGRTTASVTEALTYYADETLPLDDSVTSGAPLIPDRAGVDSSRWRVEWTSLDEWALKGVDLPPGVRVASNQTHLDFEEPLRAVATFDRNGLTGRLTLPLDLPVEEALIGSSARVTLPVNHESDGTFSATGSILPPGEYLASTLLDNEQSRRQAIYRDVFRVKDRDLPALRTPHLLFWSQPLLPGSGSTVVRNEIGSSLVLIPLELQRPSQAGEFLIPGPLLSYESVPLTKVGGIPSYFSNRTSEWTEARKASRILLRFQIPPAVLPVSPTSATLTIKLSAGSRKVRIEHGLRGNLTEAKELDSPVGTFDIPLEFGGSDVLDDSGGLHVLLEVGDVEADDEDSLSGDDSGLKEVRDEYWKVDWMSLALRAEVDAADPANVSLSTSNTGQ